MCRPARDARAVSPPGASAVGPVAWVLLGGADLSGRTRLGRAKRPDGGFQLLRLGERLLADAQVVQPAGGGQYGALVGPDRLVVAGHRRAEGGAEPGEM